MEALEGAGLPSLWGLSDWFDPFLPGFVRETFRSNGEVWISGPTARPDGLFLYSPWERSGSIFTRSRALAEQFFRLHRPVAVFSEHELTSNAEPFDVYALDLRTGPPDLRFRQPVRAATEADRPAAMSLLREVQGAIDEAWFRGLPADAERCFVSESERRIVGAAWASRAGDCGRLHSLCVRPRYRGLGIGTDLAYARLLWLRNAGATRAISEIAARNEASRRVAERVGMTPVGRLFEHVRL